MNCDHGMPKKACIHCELLECKVKIMQLKEGLRKFCRHDIDCRRLFDDEAKCTCGLAKLLEEK